MKFSSKERPLQWICDQYKRGNISFSHKLQRPIGQWNPKMKSFLIHSLLSGYPVNPIYTVEENGLIYTLDGSQRTSTCINYINNEFALSKDTPSVIIESKKDGESVSKTYDIAGKKFDKLDEEVQSFLLSCSLEFCTLSEYTENDVKEMFRRQNTSKPLNGKLLRIIHESDAFSDAVYSLANHPFIDKLVTPTMRKNGTDRDLIIQTIMLIMTNKENDFTSFRKKDIDLFVTEHGDESLDKVEMLRDAMDKLNESFNEVKIPITSVPMILYSGYRIVKDKKSFSKLIDVINEFLSGYDSNEDYKQYCVQGTSNSSNVSGRMNYWRSIIREL